MKIFQFFLVLLLLAPLAQAQTSPPPDDNDDELRLVGELRGVVDYIHHDKVILVISDRSLKMPLNMKVFDDRGRAVNRFALKPGQSVQYFSRYDAKAKLYYVDWVRLLD